jgi:hypothetical protein
MLAQKTLKQRALVIGLIILGVLLTVFFGMRAFHAFNKFEGNRPPPPGKVQTDVELIRGWMTIPFIAETYRVPENEIFDSLKIPSQGNREKSLKDLNKEYYGNTNGFVMDTVKSAVLAFQASHPPHDSASPAVPTPTQAAP